jgi:hypothetical protein
MSMLCFILQLYILSDRHLLGCAGTPMNDVLHWMATPLSSVTAASREVNAASAT